MKNSRPDSSVVIYHEIIVCELSRAPDGIFLT